MVSTYSAASGLGYCTVALSFPSVALIISLERENGRTCRVKGKVGGEGGRVGIAIRDACIYLILLLALDGDEQQVGALAGGVTN